MKSREFDNILDECLQRILTGGETIEQCLAAYPEHAAELEPLLQTALSTRQTLSLTPRPEFKERARHQIMAELKDIEERRRNRFALFRWQPRWVTAVVAVMVLLLAGGGTVATAANSMPDGALYPVKLATEGVRLAITPSALGKAELYARLVDKRVSEIVRMVDKGKTTQVERTTERLNNQLVAMSNLVDPRDGQAEAPAAATPRATQAPPPTAAVEPAEKQPGLTLAPAPPPAAAVEPPEKQPGLTLAPAPPPEADEAPAIRAIRPAGNRTEARIAPAPPVSEGAQAPQLAPALAPPPEVEGDEAHLTVQQARLRQVVLLNIAKHREALRAALARAPESARPAILRAIAASDAEYERMLRALMERARKNRGARENEENTRGEPGIDHDERENDNDSETDDESDENRGSSVKPGRQP
jgi:hypothetical protein